MAEAEFVRRAIALGLTVCQPFNEGARFDFSVHSARTALRVQVKSRWTRSPDGHYTLPVSHRLNSATIPYTADETDILAAYLGPDDIWYIIPVSAAIGRVTAHFNPHRVRCRGRFEPFREAWHLLFEPPACSRLCPSAAKAGHELAAERHG